MAVNEEKKEYADWLKSAAKELIDGIGTDSDFDISTLERIYTYIRIGFLDNRTTGRKAV